MNRLLLLVQRSVIAFRLGFVFRGTRSFRCPKRVSVGRKQVDLKVPESNKGVHTDFINILIDDEYKLKSLKKCFTILDIGANIGLLSLWARMRFPDARIIAVEPNPVAFDFLKHNALTLRLELHQIVLGLSDDAIEIESDDDITCCKVNMNPNGNIAMRRFSKFVESTVGGQIDLLKMDCEGFEWELFKDDAAFKQVKNIHMEYHLTENRTLAEFEALVDKAGFSIYQIVQNDGFGMAFLTHKVVRKSRRVEQS